MKPNGTSRFTIDYRHLNANTASLTAALPNIAEIVTQIQSHNHQWMAAIDVKDMFFMVPLQEEEKSQFTFTWRGIQYTFNRLPQGYKHSPTIVHMFWLKYWQQYIILQISQYTSIWMIY